MDETTNKDEARDFVEHIVRTTNQDPQSIPPKALKRAIKAATDAVAELRKAAELAQEDNR